MARKRHEEAEREFDDLLDEVIEDFNEAVRTHLTRLEALREALRDG